VEECYHQELAAGVSEIQAARFLEVGSDLKRIGSFPRIAQ
jgi:hypothetical protein